MQGRRRFPPSKLMPRRRACPAAPCHGRQRAGVPPLARQTEPPAAPAAAPEGRRRWKRPGPAAALRSCGLRMMLRRQVVRAERCPVSRRPLMWRSSCDSAEQPLHRQTRRFLASPSNSTHPHPSAHEQAVAPQRRLPLVAAALSGRRACAGRCSRIVRWRGMITELNPLHTAAAGSQGREV